MSRPAQATPSHPELAWRLPLTTADDAAQELTDREDEDLSGLMAGNYRLVNKLGEGGLASVWLGQHPVIGSRVAVKVLHADVSSSREATRRFVMEARAVNHINSEQVVRIFDFGCLPGGRDYAVMELLEGETLAERLDRGPLCWSQASNIACEVLEALGAAHQAGVVHRDIKPENVHLGQGPEPQVKLLDFGIAKLVQDARGDMTQRGYCIGTPAYAAPEQLTGGRIGPATDVYACGELLYEMLTGEPPFTGPLKPMVKAKLTREPQPIDERVPGLPEQVVQLIHAMLEHDPEQRPSAHQALEILRSAASLDLPPVSWSGRDEVSVMDTLPGAPPALLEDVDLFKNVVWGAEGGTEALPPPALPARRCHRPLLLSVGISAGVALVLVAGWLLFNLLPGWSHPADARVIDARPTPPIRIRVNPPPAVKPLAAPAPAVVKHRVSLATRPAGALVRIDGRDVGRTPLRLQAEQGETLDVTFLRKGHRPARRRLTVDGPHQLTVALERLPRPGPRRPRPSEVDWVDPF